MAQWIDTGGGPFIMVPEQVLEAWRGVFGGPSEGQTDYDLACAVDDYLGVVGVGGLDALVLGDEPLSTAIYRDEKTGEVLLARWSFADSEDAIEAAIVQTSDSSPSECSVELTLPRSCVLFDAAEPGNDITGDKLKLTLKAGKYRVDTHTRKPNSRTCVVVHRLSERPGDSPTEE